MCHEREQNGLVSTECQLRKWKKREITLPITKEQEFWPKSLITFVGKDDGFKASSFIFVYNDD